MSQQMTSRRWLGLAALVPALAMVFIDQSVLPVALPTIQREFGATSAQLQWAINAYLLVTAVLVLAGGKIGDWIGYRRAFTLGMIVFALSSAMCGMSQTISWLIAARALQGVGAALMFPASSALLMSLFSSRERGRASGIHVSVSSLFLIIGPLIGGYLTEAVNWRWIFWINLPIAAAGLFFTLLFISKSESGKFGFDFLGFLFYLVGASLLITAMMQGEAWGWSSPTILTLFFIGAVSTALLFLREKYAKHPFLDLSLFRHPVYKAVTISVFATSFILMITVFRTMFFQEALSWSPMKSGMITVISSAPVLFMSPIGGVLSDRYGPKLPIALGFLLLIASFVWTALFIQSSLEVLIFGLMAFGIGIPLIFTPSYASAMGAIPPAKAGVAFGTISSLRSLASTVGVAVIGSFIDQVRLFSFGRKIAENPSMISLDVEQLEGIVLADPAAQDYLTTLPPEILTKIFSYLHDSEVAGFVLSHMALAVLLLIAFAFVFVLYQRKSSHHLPSSPAEGWD